MVSGAKKAFYLICNVLLDDRSKVLLIDPAYPDYQRAILNFTQNIYKLDANNRLPNVSDIEEMVRSKGINVIIFNYPNNPTGTIANTDFWERVHNLSKIYNLKIINDFTYSDYVYTDTSSSMFSSLNNVSNDYMYEIYSFSKNFTIPGWRIAAIICSQRNIEKINFLNNIMESGIFTPMIITLNQMILSNQKRVKVSLYHKKAKLLCKKIQTLTNWECSVPDSGMFLWIKLKNINSWEFFKEKMENENLIILPGILYGEKYINFIRLSLNFNLHEIDEIITRLVNGEKYDEIS
uniref:pyridoxal phosphate-dependent aminotransferase n=1 Tax=Staphylococcus sp. MI 10-1553 TaxID=1912064 RepID=UPI0023B29A9B|nr:pyridoxal phosphate-dependent aminotransferase [Staphylococcus sp. MI 10-1553]